MASEGPACPATMTTTSCRAQCLLRGFNQSSLESSANRYYLNESAACYCGDYLGQCYFPHACSVCAANVLCDEVGVTNATQCDAACENATGFDPGFSPNALLSSCQCKVRTGPYSYQWGNYICDESNGARSEVLTCPNVTAGDLDPNEGCGEINSAETCAQVCAVYVRSNYSFGSSIFTRYSAESTECRCTCVAPNGQQYTACSDFTLTMDAAVVLSLSSVFGFLITLLVISAFCRRRLSKRESDIKITLLGEAEKLRDCCRPACRRCCCPSPERAWSVSCRVFDRTSPFFERQGLLFSDRDLELSFLRQSKLTQGGTGLLGAVVVFTCAAAAMCIAIATFAAGQRPSESYVGVTDVSIAPVGTLALLALSMFICSCCCRWRLQWGSVCVDYRAHTGRSRAGLGSSLCGYRQFNLLLQPNHKRLLEE